MAGPYHPVRWLRRYVRKADGPYVWPLLLKEYSGLMLLVHIVFGSIYFLPVLIRMLVLTGTLPLATTSDLESLRDVLEHDSSTWDLLMFGFLGTDSLAGWIAVGLSLALLTYNVLRAALTFRIAQLRRYVHPPVSTYRWMYRVHRPWMYILFALSLAFGGQRIYDALHLHTILKVL